MANPNCNFLRKIIARTGIAVLLVLLLSLGGCSGKSASTSTAARTDSSNAQPNPSQQEITEIASLAKGRVGVSAMVLETGETVAALNSQDHFPMQSVYKLPISMAVMKQADAGKTKLEQKLKIAKEDYVGGAAHSPIRDRYRNGAELMVNELLRFALSESDGTASDVLMKLAGGHGAVQSYLTELGIKDMIVLDTEQSFTQDHSLQYRNFASPDAAVALLRALYEHRGLSESSQALVLKFMTESTTGPKRLKGLLPVGTNVAHKTGTSGTENGITAATNDIGIIILPNGKHLAIAVFVSDSPADEATRESTIAKIAKAVWDSLSKQ
ncbi:MAG TPA: class A beta-lactamase [Pyrinomonadaceae bacterium]